jgi:superfamily II DNA helicase RecQ
MQSSFRQQQLEKMVRFAEGGRCRMGALIEHFGDVDDASRRCGLCDFCAPDEAVAQVFRPLTGSEKETVLAIARALRSVQHMSTGKLHKQLFPREQMHRDEFEVLLTAMARGGYATLEDAEFEAEGRTITYRKVRLTDEGEELRGSVNLRLFVPDTSPEPVETPAARKRAGGSAKKKDEVTERASQAEPELTASELDLEKRLRAWRLDEAKRNNFPAFRIFGDKTLRAIVLDCPTTIEDLLRVNGIGPEKAAKFGESICGICAVKN